VPTSTNQVVVTKSNTTRTHSCSPSSIPTYSYYLYSKMSDFKTRARDFGICSAEETKAAWANPDTIVIDVRREDEVAADGKIDHANWNQVSIVLDDASKLEEAVGTMAPNKESLVFIHCKSGRRASKAVSSLKAMGYGHVLNGGGYGDVNSALEL
jgi:rhodanese-related sulfurtransferase